MRPVRKLRIRFTLNGKDITAVVDGGETLLDLLREKLNLTGTKSGCRIGQCGACTTVVDGKPVASCLMLAGSVDGRKVETIEGLCGDDNKLHPIQRAFLEEDAVACGFCSPGMIMSAKALLESNPDPDETQIREAISGNLCRCTGYQPIVNAIKKSALLIGQQRRLKNDEGQSD